MTGYDSEYSGVIGSVPPPDSVSNCIYRVVHRGVLQEQTFVDEAAACDHLDVLKHRWRVRSGAFPRIEVRVRMGRTSGFQHVDRQLHSTWLVTDRGEHCVKDDYGLKESAEEAAHTMQKLLDWPIVREDVR